MPPLSRSRRTPPSRPRPLTYIHHLRGMGLTKRGTHVESPILPTLSPHPRSLYTAAATDAGVGSSSSSGSLFPVPACRRSLAAAAAQISGAAGMEKMEESVNYRSCRYQPWGGGGSKAAGISVEKKEVFTLYLSVDGEGHATMLWSAASKQDSMCPFVLPDAVELRITGVGSGEKGGINSLPTSTFSVDGIQRDKFCDIVKTH